MLSVALHIVKKSFISDVDKLEADACPLRHCT